MLQKRPLQQTNNSRYYIPWTGHERLLPLCNRKKSISLQDHSFCVTGMAKWGELQLSVYIPFNCNTNERLLYTLLC